MAEVRVTTNYGTLAGASCKTEDGFEYLEFLQIPYAKPPVGELRFKNPVPPDPWVGIRDATKIDEKNISYQFDIMTKTQKGSEDCLYLNVYTPRLGTERQKLLPVMVYIHGGGFALGNGIVKSEAGPDFLITEDVVVVSLNYRVGIFGFLSLNIPEASGNMGLKDQVMALKWIQNNIDKFGGDKHNVCLFGISAGGAAIDYLILSPLAKGLFQKAAVQSGSSLNPWAFDDNTFELSIQTAKQLGFQGSLENIPDIYNFLMQQPTKELGDMTLKFASLFEGKSTDFGFAPCVEKQFGSGEEFITEKPFELLKKALFNDVIMLRGFCEYEGIAMSSMRPHNVLELIEKKNFTEFLSYKLNSDENSEYNLKLLNAYMKDRNDKEEKEQSVVDFLGDYDFSSGIWIGSKQMADKGSHVYHYIFAYDGKFNLSKLFLSTMQQEKEVKVRKGASHGDDIGYLLKHTLQKDLDYSEKDVIVKKRMIKMWTNFARTGNPTPETSDLIHVKWPLFTTDQQQYLKIDEELAVESKYQPERMAIFEELYEKFRK